MISRNEDYPYFYETHLHTNVGSACATSSPVEMAKACKEAGYAGIFITEHNWGGNCKPDRNLPWKDYIRELCRGYREAKAWADDNDFDVFFGYEAGYNGTEFLIYGIDEKWIIDNEILKTATIEKQYELVKSAGGMVIHAHPYREEYYIPKIRLYPDYVDGVEIINATHSNSRSISHNDPEYDTKAIRYCNENNLLPTAGSDVHSTNLFNGGMAFKRKILDERDFVKSVLGKEDYILTNGEMWFDKKGNPID